MPRRELLFSPSLPAAFSPMPFPPLRSRFRLLDSVSKGCTPVPRVRADRGLLGTNPVGTPSPAQLCSHRCPWFPPQTLPAPPLRWESFTLFPYSQRQVQSVQQLRSGGRLAPRSSARPGKLPCAVAAPGARPAWGAGAICVPALLASLRRGVGRARALEAPALSSASRAPKGGGGAAASGGCSASPRAAQSVPARRSASAEPEHLQPRRRVWGSRPGRREKPRCDPSDCPLPSLAPAASPTSSPTPRPLDDEFCLDLQGERSGPEARSPAEVGFGGAALIQLRQGGGLGPGERKAR